MTGSHYLLHLWMWFLQENQRDSLEVSIQASKAKNEVNKQWREDILGIKLRNETTRCRFQKSAIQ